MDEVKIRVGMELVRKAYVLGERVAVEREKVVGVRCIKIPHRVDVFIECNLVDFCFHSWQRKIRIRIGSTSR